MMLLRSGLMMLLRGALLTELLRSTALGPATGLTAALRSGESRTDKRTRGDNRRELKLFHY